MLELIRSLFSGPEDVAEESHPTTGTVAGAAAALMVEAAGLDGTFDDNELATISNSLQRSFGLSAEDAEALIEEGRRVAENSNQIYDVVRTIREGLEADQRILVIELLWETAYADGKLHDFEANLVRRVAGLLYVPDQDSGAARKRVIERLGLSTED